MNKFLSVLAIGLVAGSLSVNAFANEAAKPAATKTANMKVEKKETSLKATVKKAAPSANKKAEAK